MYSFIEMGIQKMNFTFWTAKFYQVIWLIAIVLQGVNKNDNCAIKNSHSKISNSYTFKIVNKLPLTMKGRKPSIVFGHEYVCCLFTACRSIIENTLTGCGFEHSDLVKGVPDYNRSLEMLIFKGPFQPKPRYNSVIYLHEREYFPRTWKVTALLKTFETVTIDMTILLWEINRN